MREDARRVGRRVDDIVGELAARRIQIGGVADALRDLVIGTRRVAADAEAADDAAVTIKCEAAAEEDSS